MPLEHDARRHPLTDQLEELARSGEDQSVVGARLTPLADLDHPEHVSVPVPVDRLDLLPRDAHGQAGDGQVQRLAGPGDHP